MSTNLSSGRKREKEKEKQKKSHPWQHPYWYLRHRTPPTNTHNESTHENMGKKTNYYTYMQPQTVNRTVWFLFQTSYQVGSNVFETTKCSGLVEAACKRNDSYKTLPVTASNIHLTLFLSHSNTHLVQSLIHTLLSHQRLSHTHSTFSFFGFASM